MKPFFSLITRTLMDRAELFARCKRSVDHQTFQDFEHMVLLDREGVGVAAAQKMMHTAAPRGEYVLVLDDDDFLSDDTVLSQLHAALADARPAFAVVKVAHGVLGEMPLVWGDGQVPQCGQITVSNALARRDVWYQTRGNFGAHYAGDYDWLASLFGTSAPVWVDVCAVTVELMRNGRADPSPAQIEAMAA